MTRFASLTSVLALSVGLAGPAAAQDDIPVCTQMPADQAFPCTIGGELLEAPQQLIELLAANPQALEEGRAEAAAVTEQAAEEPAQAAADTPEETADQTAEETPDEATPRAAPEDMPAEAARTAEGAPPAETASEPLDTPAEAAQAGTEETDVQAERAPAEIADTPADAARTAEGEPPAETASEPLDIPAEAAQADPGETEPAAETAAQNEETFDADELPQVGDDTATGEPLPEIAEEEPDTQPEVAETAQMPAAAAAAADADAGEAAQVIEETLTEEDVRSSAEDFDTAVTAGGVEAPAARADDDDDDGLSTFERALLLGLGAVAVGSILDNGAEVVSNTGDRVVVREGDQLRVLKDDNALLRQPGSDVRTETFSDGSTRTVIAREDGSRIVTIRAADGTVLRRARIAADGTETLLIDDTRGAEAVDLAVLPEPVARPAAVERGSEDALRAALAAELAGEVDRRFSLAQVRAIPQVRALAPEVEVDAITFPTGSAAIPPSQARELADLGLAIRELVARAPETVLLVEGHTDAVGDATYNLALSDRRAETVALALSEYFDVPPENLVTQGYGESQLKVQTPEAEPANRRAVVRNVTGLLN